MKNKFKNIILLILLGFSFHSCQSRVRPVENTLREAGPFSSDFFETSRDPDNQRVFVVAHRGDWRNVPENSLASIENCIAMGVDMVEVDVRRSADGHFVLIHDETVDRTSNGKGRVSDMTLNQLQELRLINAQGELTDHKIPSLEEALSLAKGKIMLNLDKVFDYYPQVYPLIAAQNMEAQVLLKSSKPANEVIQLLGDSADTVLFMPIVRLNDKDFAMKIADYKAQLDPIGFELIFNDDKNENIALFKEIRQDGSAVWVNSLWASLCGGHHDKRSVKDPDGSWGWIIDKGANIIQTDRPEELLQYLEERGLR